MGLTQERLATLSGLSRQTISQVETGTVPDLGLVKAEKLASVLGLTLRVDAGRPISTKPRMPPLARAAISASVSFKTPISAAQLKKILATGKMPDRYQPHVNALLDDAPVSLLASVAGQLHDESGLSRDEVWNNYRNLASMVKSFRDIWQ